MPESDNFTRLSQAIALLGDTLRPYVERELKRAGGNWWTEYVLPHVSPLARQKMPSMPKRGVNGQLAQLDVADLLQLISRNWAAAFRTKLPDAARSWANELHESRTQWAHKGSGDLAEAVVDRAIDTAALLLDGVDPSAAAAMRLLKERAGAGREAPPASTNAPIETPGAATRDAVPRAEAPPITVLAPSFADAGLRPWREVVTPRPDVRTGRLTQSQFAADLHEVYRGNPAAGAEYLDPREFFERTYVTSGVREFLKTALRRLTGLGGDPVVQLKTGFGGGKTHTMLALYHVARSSATLIDEVPVLKELSEELGVKLPEARVAALVGTKISATAEYQDETLRSLGISLKTLWGHLAWQLGGWDAYKLVQKADDAGVAPADELRQVLEMAAPCVILMDEMVAYGRNLPERRGQVPGGNLASLLTFVHTLSEMVKATPGTILAVSIPESDQEIGGVQGEQVLRKIQETIGRLETAWQPVAPAESFEVVRRRLFESVPADGRDQAVAGFIKYYRENKTDFPAEAQERAYEERMKAAYPFHPELFDRLYLDWHPYVPHFQYTRGVLRLLAGAVQAMWRENDQAALIMPSTVRFDLPEVREELMRYLPAGFQAVLDGDIEGPSSEAVQIDASNPRFGRVGAARAVARTILFGSVPGKDTPGLEDVRIRLGAARPGEPVATYNDVMGRLRDRAQFLHGSGSRYWFGVRPNLNKTVADRISRIQDDEVYAYLATRLRDERDAGIFAGKHVAPESTADVPDDTAVRLVVVSPRFPHHTGTDDSPALTWALDTLSSRGNAPRLNRNMLVFALFDDESHAGLVEAVKSFLAWDSIAKEQRRLNLDEEQVKQATESRDNAQKSVDALLGEGYRWAAVPERSVRQEDDKWIVGDEDWRFIDTSRSIGSTGTLAQRVAFALQAEERLLAAWSPIFLKRELDRWFWSQPGVEFIAAKKLWEENLTRYVYFPRLRNREVFTKAVQEGATSRDFFGFALGHEGGKYSGLSFGQRPASVVLDEAAVIVRPDVAEAELQKMAPLAGDNGPAGSGGGSQSGGGAVAPPPLQAKTVKRFYGRIKLSPQRLGSSAGQVSEEVLQHLAGLVGADVEVELDITVRVPDGIPDRIIRTVTENARTLKFEDFGFETE